MGALTIINGLFHMCNDSKIKVHQLKKNFIMSLLTIEINSKMILVILKLDGNKTRKNDRFLVPLYELRIFDVW